MTGHHDSRFAIVLAAFTAQDDCTLTSFASGTATAGKSPSFPADAGIQTPVYPCKQQSSMNLRAAGMKTPCVCIMAGKPHGTRYTGGLGSRLRGNDGFRTVVRLKCNRPAVHGSCPNPAIDSRGGIGHYVWTRHPFLYN